VPAVRGKWLVGNVIKFPDDGRIVRFVRAETVPQMAGAEEVVGAIGHGLLVLLGVAPDDTPAQAQWLADKVIGLRVFNDAAGKMNLGVADVGGSVLVVIAYRAASAGCAHRTSCAPPIWGTTQSSAPNMITTGRPGSIASSSRPGAGSSMNSTSSGGRSVAGALALVLARAATSPSRCHAGCPPVGLLCAPHDRRCTIGAPPS